jgi:hypothetical protein
MIDPSKTPNDIEECVITCTVLNINLKQGAVGVVKRSRGRDKERGISDRGFLVRTLRGDLSCWAWRPWSIRLLASVSVEPVTR